MASKVGPLGEYLKEQRRSAQLSLRQLAEEAGVSNPYLSQIERGLRRPSADVLQRIAGALQISSEAMYVRAGLLDERSDATPVEQAIQSDEGLTARQRLALMDIYQSFRLNNELVGGHPKADHQDPHPGEPPTGTSSNQEEAS